MAGGVGPANGIGMGTLAVAMAPVWTLLILLGFARDLYALVWLNPPSILGQPVGALLIIVGLLLGIAGLVGVARARGPQGRVLALAGLTLPATVIVAFTPLAVRLVVELG